MIGSIIGLVTLLLALVLGLLVWTSYGVYTNQNTESQSLGPLILKLDFALEQYGPEARRGRDLLRRRSCARAIVSGAAGERRIALCAIARGSA